MGEMTMAGISVVLLVAAIGPVALLVSSLMANETANQLMSWGSVYVGGFVFFAGVLGLGLLANWKYLSKRED